MSVFSEVLLALIFGIFLILWFRLKNKNRSFYKTIPGSPPNPIFGNVLEVKSTQDILDVLMKEKKEYGGLYLFHIGPFAKNLIVTDYKFLEFVLSSTRVLKKTDDYDFLLPWLGTGLLTSTGAKWKSHRRMLTPAFHFQILEQFIEIFESGATTLVNELKEKVGCDSVDIYRYVTLCTLDIICETAMGTKINAQGKSNSNYVQSVKTMCRIIMERSIFPLQMNDWTYILSKNYFAQKKAIKTLHNQTNSVIDKRRQELASKKESLYNKKKKAFLDLLLESTIDGQPLTQEEIREEVDTFMFEGHDTTASAISFAIFCLANNPDVQAKALEEQNAIFGTEKNPKVSYANLQSMKYLEQVIKETLRLYPSVPIYGRKTTEPVEFDGKIIPEDVTIAIFAYGIHRDPEYFPDPEKFNPGRFDNVDGKLPFAYIPFSAGPRNCIGQKFAMLEMKSTISKVLRTFQLNPAKPEHKLQLAAETVLKSANGINISFNLRN